MTDDQVREWAREAGLDWHRGFVLDNEENRYAALARLARADVYSALAGMCKTRSRLHCMVNTEACIEAGKIGDRIEALAAAEKEPRP